MSDVHHPRCTGFRAGEAWIRRFIGKPCDDLVLMTGEGVRRLMKVVRRTGVEPGFIVALGKARKFSRSQTWPRAARDRAGAAGNDGKADLRGRRGNAVARRSQGPSARPATLPGQGHSVLIGTITAQGAEVDTVLPYVYDPQAAENKSSTQSRKWRRAASMQWR